MLTFAFFRRWQYLIITYGSTRTSLFSTWWSKYPPSETTFSKNSPCQTELLKLSNARPGKGALMDDNYQIAWISWAERWRRLQIFMPFKKLFCSQSIGVFSDLAGLGPAVGCFAKTTELSPTSVSPWNPATAAVVLSSVRRISTSSSSPSPSSQPRTSSTSSLSSCQAHLSPVLCNELQELPSRRAALQPQNRKQ